jgi:hypothetical protein
MFLFCIALDMFRLVAKKLHDGSNHMLDAMDNYHYDWHSLLPLDTHRLASYIYSHFLWDLQADFGDALQHVQRDSYDNPKTHVKENYLDGPFVEYTLGNVE